MKFKFKFIGRVAAALTCLAAPATAWAGGPFDGARAMALVREQCAFGPRVPGTPPHVMERDWLTSQARSLGWHAQLQPFATSLPLNGQKNVRAWNVWMTPRQSGPLAPALIVSAHWDTRPWADRDPSGARPSLLGANDGASGVAVALELARSLEGDPMRDHLVLAFWDAEDSGVNGDIASWGLGAQAAAANPPAWIDRVVLGVNLDMIGGEDLTLTREAASLRNAPRAVASIWQIGRALAPGQFLTGAPIAMDDDHLPWIRAGVPFVDLIGFPYRHWHTAGDAPDHCSAAMMQRVGEVMKRYVEGSRWRDEGRPLPASRP